MNGIINVNKEKGYTSHDVVAKLRGICHQKKIGHTGTLDPDATGVLPVCLGNATKLCDFLTDKSKEYEALMLLGKTSDTYDASGVMLTESPTDHLTPSQVREVVMSFVPGYEQVPPMYSAKKVNGKKLYELAREGKEIERKSVYVTIPEIEILSMELPYVRMRISCEKGTYIRSLCHDIGAKLGCGALMQELIRTRVAEYTLDKAMTLSQIEEAMRDGTLETYLTPTDLALSVYPAVTAQPLADKLLNNGNAFPERMLSDKLPDSVSDGGIVRVYNASKSFIGLYSRDVKARQMKAYKMFLGD